VKKVEEEVLAGNVPLPQQFSMSLTPHQSLSPCEQSQYLECFGPNQHDHVKHLQHRCSPDSTHSQTP
jgi:hypothetical protein